MPFIPPQKLIDLQQSPENIRNICILAHVDHGKTSLTDVLLATNGIISPKLAGKIRFLDSRPDEQARGITMESSAISLYFSMMMRRKQAGNDSHFKASEVEEYLINLIDSPGHIDFQSEVSTASRLCDGAIVLVDAVEGVCSQTVTVLRQTWVEKLKPILVINKIDRLITELGMTSAEAYLHFVKLLENVNAVMGSFFQGDRMEEDLRWRERMEERATAAAAVRAHERDVPMPNSSTLLESLPSEADYKEKDDEDIYFAPEKNNVIFSSAIDGWAFTVKQFAAIYERKLGTNRSVLEKVLWGDFYLDPKTKRILGSKHLKGRYLKPMFVQLVLDNIWAVYQATVGGTNNKVDEVLLNKILTSLSISIPVHILKSRNSQNILTAIFAKWLPLSTALLVSVIEQLPSPPRAQKSRMPALLDTCPGASHVSGEIRSACVEFSQAENKPNVAFVSKMIAVVESELPRNIRSADASLASQEARKLAAKKRAEVLHAYGAQVGDSACSKTCAPEDADLDHESKTSQIPEHEDKERLIGFARLYSGTLKTGATIYVIPPKYSASLPSGPTAIPVKVEALYLLMGRSLIELDSVPAGTIFGIEGLESALIKSGTICSLSEGAPNLAGIASTQVAPIVRVALEPENPGDHDSMIRGLKMLERADPCATYEVLESGEYVLATAGELHLERCLKDLRERFAQCEIQAGEPIVPYRESIVNQPTISGEVAMGPRGTTEFEIGKGTINVRLRVRPLPSDVTKYLANNSSATRNVVRETQRHKQQNLATEEDITTRDNETDKTITPAEYAQGIKQAFAKSGGEASTWHQPVDRILAFGPNRTGPNLLLDSTGLLGRTIFSANNKLPDGHSSSIAAPLEIADKIIHAFQLATSQGPLCHEPVQGIAVDIEKVEILMSTKDLTLLTGELIKLVRENIRIAFLEWSPRLYLAVYRCEIQTPTESLGRVYPVLTRRHAQIQSEVLSEASNVYSITSLLALHESFGFSDEIRKRTSGGATAQMVYHGFEMLDEDPFWVPATEEEIEDLGDTADRINQAKALVDRIRERKGLLVMSRKLDAEKERNMKR